MFCAQERKLLLQEKKRAHLSLLRPSYHRNARNSGKQCISRTLSGKQYGSHHSIKTNHNTLLFRLNKAASSHCGNKKALHNIKENHSKRKGVIYFFV